MHTNFRAIGISYRDTPLDIRESVTFSELQVKQFFTRLKDTLAIDEALILSTCNRTELYYFSTTDLSHELASLVDIFHGTLDRPSAEYFHPMNHDEAVRHLFEVSLGLDSMVLGDIQITNQVKKAYQWSADEQMAGPFLHRLMHTIFYTNKRMVQETTFRDGTASVASAAVNIAEQFLLTFTNPKVAVVGLGEIGENVAENFRDVPAEITLVNRTLEKAEKKAAELNFRVAPFENLNEVVATSNVVICAVQADEPVIKATLLQNNHQPKLLIDLSVPRSIEEQVAQVSGVILYNVDQLQEKASKALEQRRAAIPQVAAIITESINEFGNWSNEMEVSPTIKKLKEALEEIRKQELARYIDKMDEKEAKILDKATRSMIQKVLKLPVLQLKAACKRGEAETLVGVLNDLFNLEQEKTTSK